jgi:hypothetical protein
MRGIECRSLDPVHRQRISVVDGVAALRYQHVIDGQDADIARYLERFGEEPPCPPVHTMTRHCPFREGT